MGIKQLSRLLKENCKKGIKERPIEMFANKRIAIDSSLCIYKFLIALRADGNTLSIGDTATSHLVGMFYKTIKLIELGIVPVYVFDGVPPQMKLGELQKRLERRITAVKEYKEAELAGNKVKMEMMDKRSTKVLPKHNEDCKKLLELMGVPYITAPSEAEAYCAFLCKKGMVDAVATEDMDALTFGAPVLIRNLHGSKTKSQIVEYNLSQLLSELGMEMSSFIDLCILLGCDYCDTIRGVGPKKAIQLVKEHGTIENILKNNKLDVDEKWQFQEARLIFEGLPSLGSVHKFEIRWNKIDREMLLQFLVVENGFDEVRVGNGIDRLKIAQKKTNQGRLDTFFKKSLI